MTLNKKNLFKLKLLALVLTLGTACDETQVPEGETPVTTTTTTTYEGREIKPGAAALVPGMLTKSGDNRFIYVTNAANTALYAGKVGARTHTALTIPSKPADPEAVGQADLTNATDVKRLVPTEKGVMASVANTAGNNHWGVALFEEDVAQATVTWKTTRADGDFSIATAVNDREDPTHGFMVYYKAGAATSETPYILSTAKVGFFTVAAGASMNTKLVQISTSSTNLIPGNIVGTVGHKASGSAYVIDSVLGVARVAPADVNPAAGANKVPAILVATDAVNGKGLDLFSVKGATAAAVALGANSGGVSVVTIVGDKLYVAFDSNANTNGGVAVVELNAANGELGAVHAPSNAWAGYKVLHLTKDGNSVYAVAHPHGNAAAASIFEVTATADKGAELTDWINAKAAGTANKAIGGDIKFAELAGNELYVATSTGFFNITKTTVTR